MSTTGYQNTFNTGTDQSISVFPASAQISQILSGVVPPLATAFFDGKRSSMNMKYADVLLKGEPTDDGGLPDHRVIGDGLTGRIEVEKQNDSFAQLYAFLDNNYYNGGSQNYFTIIETIRSPKPNGPTTRWRYTNVVFHGYDPGTWAKKQITKATVEVACQQRIPM